MRQFVTPWRILVLLVLGSGCAAQPPRVSVAPSVPLAGSGELAVQPQARAEVPEPPPLPQPVRENQTFVTVEGVPRYKIGPGDLLEILLTRGLTQEKQTVVVKTNGVVTVGFVEAKVAELTPEQAAEEIRGVLRAFYKQISVEVLVKEYSSKKVAVLGAAGKVGVFPLKGRTSVLDFFAEIGGAAPNADLERVRLIRPDGRLFTINLSRLLTEGDALRELVLDTGDLLFIPARATAEEKRIEEKRVFVLGEVKSPGAFLLLPNMRLSHLLAQAGGPTDLAVLDSARIIRGGLATPQVVQTDFRKVIQEGDQRYDLPLQTGDLVVLPRSGIGNWNAFLAKIRPTLEILTFPLQSATQLLILRDFLQRRD